MDIAENDVFMYAINRKYGRNALPEVQVTGKTED